MKLLVASVLTLSVLSSGSVVQYPKDGTFELLILHNNDMHARFEQTSQLSGTCTTADRDAGKCYGGFPRVAHVVKEARRAAKSGEGPPVLYLNAGDTYTGTAWFTLYKSKIAIEFVNALQPDAVSLGNHEFDNGISGLTPFIENVTCPVLAANLILNKEPQLQAEPNLMKSVILDVNGTKVGVIGYLTPDTKFLAIRNNVEYIDEITAIKSEVQRLKNEEVKILVALGHSGFAKDIEIAKEVEGIDLVIGGHTNQFLWNGASPDIEKPQGPYPTLLKQLSGKLVPAVQAYAYTKYLGKLHLVFNPNGELLHFDGNPILLDKSVPQDPYVSQIVNRYRKDVISITDSIVGSTSVDLDGATCRIKECNMGNLITDAMIYMYASTYEDYGWTDAPIAIIQGGGIRASIKPLNLPANITRGELLTVMPFDGKLVKVTINGKDVKKMLEYSVAKYNISYPPGQFLQMSGMNVTYDFGKKSGNRIAEVYVRCGKCFDASYSVLNETAEYNIIMPSFLVGGGDGFSIFNNLPFVQLDYNEFESVVKFIQNNSPTKANVEGRITLRNIEKLKNTASHSKLSTLVLLVQLFCSIVVFV